MPCAAGWPGSGCGCWSGEAKRGKSTWSTRSSGGRCCRWGTPLTAMATTVRYGRDEGVGAVFRDGRAERFPLSALGDR